MILELEKVFGVGHFGSAPAFGLEFVALNLEYLDKQLFSVTVIFSGLENKLPIDIGKSAILPDLPLQILNSFLLSLQQVILLLVPDMNLALDRADKYEQYQNTQNNHVNLLAQVSDVDADDRHQA